MLTHHKNMVSDRDTDSLPLGTDEGQTGDT